MYEETERGITLIALVITIIVMLILAGISISMIAGDNGILNRAGESSFKTRVATIQEELEMYKSQKLMEDINFDESTLDANAQSESLDYNTMKDGETGDITDIFPDLTEKEKSNIEIINGEIVYKTKDDKEIEWLLELGIEPNPYEIVDGELLSSDKNLALMDKNTGTLRLPSTVTKIGDGAFANVSGLKTIIIPGNVKEIGANAFAYNTDLETVIMEDGVEIIGNSAFRNCTNLTIAEIPDSITEIGSLAFCSTSLTEINLSNKLKTINTTSFAYCKFSEVNIPNGVTTINGQAFIGCTQLKTVTMY